MTHEFPAFWLDSGGKFAAIEIEKDLINIRLDSGKSVCDISRNGLGDVYEHGDKLTMKHKSITYHFSSEFATEIAEALLNTPTQDRLVQLYDVMTECEMKSPLQLVAIVRFTSNYMVLCTSKGDYSIRYGEVLNTSSAENCVTLEYSHNNQDTQIELSFNTKLCAHFLLYLIAKTKAAIQPGAPKAKIPIDPAQNSGEEAHTSQQNEALALSTSSLAYLYNSSCKGANDISADRKNLDESGNLGNDACAGQEKENASTTAESLDKKAEQRAQYVQHVRRRREYELEKSRQLLMEQEHAKLASRVEELYDAQSKQFTAIQEAIARIEASEQLPREDGVQELTTSIVDKYNRAISGPEEIVQERGNAVEPLRPDALQISQSPAEGSNSHPNLAAESIGASVMLTTSTHGAESASVLQPRVQKGREVTRETQQFADTAELLVTAAGGRAMDSTVNSRSELFDEFLEFSAVDAREKRAQRYKCHFEQHNASLYMVREAEKRKEEALRVEWVTFYSGCAPQLVSGHEKGILGFDVRLAYDNMPNNSRKEPENLLASKIQLYYEIAGRLRNKRHAVWTLSIDQKVSLYDENRCLNAILNGNGPRAEEVAKLLASDAARLSLDAQRLIHTIREETQPTACQMHNTAHVQPKFDVIQLPNLEHVEISLYEGGMAVDLIMFGEQEVERLYHIFQVVAYPNPDTIRELTSYKTRVMERLGRPAPCNDTGCLIVSTVWPDSSYMINLGELSENGARKCADLLAEIHTVDGAIEGAKARGDAYVYEFSGYKGQNPETWAFMVSGHEIARQIEMEVRTLASAENPGKSTE